MLHALFVNLRNSSERCFLKERSIDRQILDISFMRFSRKRCKSCHIVIEKSDLHQYAVQ